MILWKKRFRGIVGAKNADYTVNTYEGPQCKANHG